MSRKAPSRPSPARPPRGLDVTIVAFDDCMTSGVYGLLDAFALAARMAQSTSPSLWRDHRIGVATLDGRAVRGFGGVRIEPDRSLAGGAGDLVIVPAILGDIEATLQRERRLVEWLAALKPVARGPILASSCTGAFMLAEAGLLDGRRVTTNPFYRALFEARYPKVALALDERIVEERRLICAGSTSAVLDLAVHVVDRLGGHELAALTAKALSIDRHAGSQRPYFLFFAPRDHGDERMLDAQEWIEERHADAVDASEMAASVHMSVRHFNRRFRAATGYAPLEYLRAVRLETAKRLLEGQERSVGAIAQRVGYADTRAFIRAFATGTGLSPSRYRQRFRFPSEGARESSGLPG